MLETPPIHEPSTGEPRGPRRRPVAELDAQTRERRAAALAQIRTFGDPVLKSRASEVSSFGPELEREAERMIAIMRDAIGVGLAATQLGVMHRLLVFQAGLDATPTAIANPELEWMSDEVATAEEGCLSLPRVAVDVERPLYARVSGLDVHGEPLLVEASGLEARVLQHEIDHLDGVLMLDRTDARAAQGRRFGRCARARATAPNDDDDSRAEADPAPEKLEVVYLGTSEFAVAVLRRLADSPHRPVLVVAPPDRPRGRGRSSRPPRWRRPPASSASSFTRRPG